MVMIMNELFYLTNCPRCLQQQ